MVKQYVLQQAQWKIDQKCAICGKHNLHFYICVDCVKQRNHDQVKRWTQNNPYDVKIHNHASRARKLGLTEHFSVEEWRDLCERYGNVCLCCRQKKPLTPDHVIPLGQERGTNTIENIQPLCMPCNARKGKKRTDYRIGTPIFEFPLTYILPQLMKLPGGTIDRFLRVE